MSESRGLKTLYNSQFKDEAYKITRSPEAAPFWEGCRQGRLMIPQCEACGRSHFYPRRFCPFCDSSRIRWIEASGRGTVYSFAIVRQPIEAAFAALVPYCIAIVELDEGIRMLTRIAGDVERVACDKPVRVTFERLSAELVVPIFVAEQGDGETLHA